MAGDDALARELEAAVRARRAELAASQEAGALADLERTRTVSEPAAVSAHPLLGRPLTLLRKLARRAVLRWYVGSVVRQQNEFNRAAADRIAELVEAQRRLARELDELRARLDRSGG